MARKVAGVDVLLKIKKDEGFIPIGGQKGASLSRSAETIDVTDKNSEGWAESIVGVKSWSIDCDGFVCLDDVAYEELEKAFEGRQPIDIEIKVGDDTIGYTRTGKAVITDFPEEYPSDDAVTFSLSLQGASPLARKKNTLPMAELSVKSK